MESQTRVSAPASAESKHLGVASFVHKRLRRLYFTALGSIALLALACQVIVQTALSDEQQDARLINVAGRQRMLSQKITKDALLLSLSKTSAQSIHCKANLTESLSQWSQAQKALLSDDFAREGSRKNSDEVETLLKNIDPCFTEMQATTKTISETNEPQKYPELAAKLVSLEPAFLTAMDHIVERYQKESEARVNAQRDIEILLFAMTLAALAVEAWFVFRPAFSQVREAVKIIENEKTLSELRNTQNIETAKLARLALRGLDTTSVMERAAKLISNILKAKLASVVEITTHDDSTKIVALSNSKEEPNISPDSAANLTGARNTNESRAVEDTLARCTAVDLDSISSTVTVPISGPTEPYGYLSAHFSEPQSLKPEEHSFLSSVGNLLGIIYGAVAFRDSLQEREAYLRCILDAAADGIIVIDQDGKIESCNKAVEALFSESTASLEGKYLLDLVIFEPLKESTATNSDFRNLLDQIQLMHRYEGELRQNTDTNISRKNKSIELVFSKLPLPKSAQKEEAAKFVVIVVDISANKEASKRITEFYSIVSHELRTPLTSIRAFFGLLEGGVLGQLPQEALEAVNVGKLESDRLSRLVNDILDISKVQADTITFNSEVLSAQALIEERLATLEPLAKSGAITLETKIQGDPQLLGDRDRVAQALSNLISNAIKFSPEQSTVTITAQETESGKVRFCVIDRGPGIACEDQEKLFKLFQQLDASDARKSSGTGLGLAITKAIIEKQNGEVGVKSEIGSGSTFWFEMPKARSN